MPSFGDPNHKFPTHSFGAQFAEAARLRASRVVSVIDAGRIVNLKLARNQIEGAVVMGVGMALFEKTNYDPRFGASINRNLADYMITTNADAPEIDVTSSTIQTRSSTVWDARGVGEIGLAGIAAGYYLCGSSREERKVWLSLQSGH